MSDVVVPKLSRAEAAAFLTARGYRISVATLGKYACVGGGPVFEKFGRRPLYTESSLIEWAKNKTTAPQPHTSWSGGGTND